MMSGPLWVVKLGRECRTTMAAENTEIDQHGETEIHPNVRRGVILLRPSMSVDSCGQSDRAHRGSGGGHP